MAGAAPPVTRPATPRRNEPCACGSGLKYKACCARKDAENKGEVIFHHGRLKPE
ncbi:MAG: hypothetical protein CO108_14750 [Deltaproteobacteria bacterium CG_4_9_14_3_um_filter_63_12]|nr:MAG: hypothetical protein COW42_15625 [Deltaproteobacteria bacterium CG17_big_fil_post_rev_8_21_14_2_50_63_7]PJB40425.1 MAG: hypothetical protein CO108_14750 [Deltaproteobacteria bacterium CG_4_9_14_3_um_filter_63_12]